MGDHEVIIMLALNTLTQSEQLIKAGFTPTQAKAQIALIETVIIDNVTTKRDLLDSETRSQAHTDKIHAELMLSIEKIRADLKSDIEKTRADLKSDIEVLHAGIKEIDANVKLEIELLRRDMNELSYKSTIKTGYIVYSAIGIAVVILSFLMKF